MALKKGLVIYPKGDGGDANYFRLLARRFKRAHPQAEISLENFDEFDEDEFLADLRKPSHKELDIFAYIGHGLTNSLLSAGVSSRREKKGFADRLRVACNNGAVILIYACNCGDLGDSLLSYLHRNTLGKRFPLYGHSTSGRAGNNPNKTVFPPEGGAKLIDQVLGPLAKARRFRAAWNETFGNESNDLWATFFLLTNEQLLRRACASALRTAATANSRRMRDVGWHGEVDRIYRFLGVTEQNEEELALAIARWQVNHFNADEVDGILGCNSWPVMRPQLAAWSASQPQPRVRQPGEVRYGPNL